ncbi:hypothetical protein [Rhodococcus kronopolitis]|uniref:Uncharacterized protein n=1 Tax=Rhodococcus kronopolitis TaxID=1460226 RepID=A0ABV9FQV4_9NOCA
MTSDPLRTLEALRPDAGAGELWPQHLQAAARARILATTTEPAPAPRPRRRVGAVCLAAALLTAGGLGVAAAAGMMPAAFTDHYSHWRNPPEPGTPAVDPAAAARIGSVPGPDGTVFSVMVAPGADGMRCVTSVFETVASAALPGPDEFIDLGNRCRQGPEDWGALGDGAGTFVVGGYGESLGGVPISRGWTYDAAAGTAVRAEIRTNTGQVLPTILADGSFFGWYPTPTAGSPRPVLTGYAVDGTIVDSFEIG